MPEPPEHSRRQWHRNDKLPNEVLPLGPFYPLSLLYPSLGSEYSNYTIILSPCPRVYWPVFYATRIVFNAVDELFTGYLRSSTKSLANHQPVCTGQDPDDGSDNDDVFQSSSQQDVATAPAFSPCAYAHEVPGQVSTALSAHGEQRHNCCISCNNYIFIEIERQSNG